MRIQTHLLTFTLERDADETHELHPPQHLHHQPVQHPPPPLTRLGPRALSARHPPLPRHPPLSRQPHCYEGYVYFVHIGNFNKDGKLMIKIGHTIHLHERFQKFKTQEFCNSKQFKILSTF